MSTPNRHRRPRVDQGSPRQVESIGSQKDMSPPRKRPRRRPRQSSSPDQRQQREVGLMRQATDPSAATSFVGSASGIYFIRSVYNVAGASAGVASQPAANSSPDNVVVPGEEDHLMPGSEDASSSTGLWQADEVVQNHGIGRTESDVDTAAATVVHVSYQDLFDWSRDYFEHWHPLYPFLSAPLVLRWFETIAQIGMADVNRGIGGSKLTIVRCVLSISLADRRQAGHRPRLPPVPSVLVFDSYKSAIQSVQDVLFTPASLESLQAAAGVQLLLVSMLRHNSASRLGGLIVRMAMQMGLHRCPTRYRVFSEDERNLRKRLFWSIFALDRHICQSLGLPLSIRDDDVDACCVNEETHTECNEKPVEDERLALLNLRSRHAQIIGTIMELRNKNINARTKDPNVVTVIAGRVTKWANEVDDLLDRESDTVALIRDVHLPLLEISKHEAIILLHRPTLAIDKTSPEYAGALHLCIAASRAVISTSYRALTNSPPAPLFWPSMTWSVWMSAFIIIFAAIEEEVPKSVALRLVDQSIEVLTHLASRGSVWPNACAMAIRELRMKLVRRPSSAFTGNGTNAARPDLALVPRDESTASNYVNPSPGRDAAMAENLPPTAYEHVGQKRRTNTNPLAAPSSNQTQPVSQPYNTATTTPGHSIDARSTTQPTSSNSWQQSLQTLTGQPMLDSLPFMSNGAAGAENVNLFDGFDIPFWIGDDQNLSFLSGLQ